MAQNDWKKIEQSTYFRQLIQEKRAFVIPATIFFLLFYFTLPILTAFTTVLNGKVIGAINWAYTYAFAQFVMTWVLSHLYLRKAARFDQLVQQVKQDTGRGVS